MKNRSHTKLGKKTWLIIWLSFALALSVTYLYKDHFSANYQPLTDLIFPSPSKSGKVVYTVQVLKPDLKNKGKYVPAPNVVVNANLSVSPAWHYFGSTFDLKSYTTNSSGVAKYEFSYDKKKKQIYITDAAGQVLNVKSVNFKVKKIKRALPAKTQKNQNVTVKIQ